MRATHPGRSLARIWIPSLVVLAAAARAGPPAQASKPAAGSAIREAYGRAAKSLVDRIARDDQDAIQAMLAPPLRLTLDRERLGRLCHNRTRAHGRPLGLGEPVADGTLATYPVRSERGSWELKLGLDLDGAIASLYLNEPPDPAQAGRPPVPEITPNRIRLDAVRAATRLIELMNKDDQDAIQDLFAPSLREEMTRQRMADLSREKIRLRGEFTRLGPPAMNAYTAAFTAFTERGDWQLKLTMDRSGGIRALYLADVAPDLPVPERPATPLRLPFRGEWTVQWGGDTEEVNYHIGTGSRPQRRAIDFVVRNAAGKAYDGDGKRNADYLAYGQDVLAAADGVVVIVIDGVPDNRPGTSGSFAATGNAVVLRHPAGESTAVYHLIPGSIAVKVGDSVRAGQVLGRCGNSGNSSGPHLHFQVTNSDDYAIASGIAPHFRDVRLARDGPERAEADYTPARRDRVRAGR